MTEKTKLSKEDILKTLNINEDTLALYNQELEITAPSEDPLCKTYTEEDFNLIKTFHNLKESGLTQNEIRLLTTISDVLKGADFEGKNEIQNLLSLSPMFRLKQSLALARKEIAELKNKVQTLEEELKKAIEESENYKDASFLKAELEKKQKTIDLMDKKLIEVSTQKSELEALLATYKEGSSQGLKIKGKKTKELYQLLIEKESEITRFKKENEELKTRFNALEADTDEIKEILDRFEEEYSEMGIEVEERYKEQIASLRADIETLVDRKQKEWEDFYFSSNKQHRNELLTLQKRHENEIMNLKRKIIQQMDEVRELRFQKNPILDFFSRLRT